MATQMRLNTSQSESNVSIHSRLSDTRRERLIAMKKREDLKDALTEKFKNRFGPGKNPGEATLSGDTISKEVNQFAAVAKVTEANLGRLERRLQNQAQRKAGAEEASVVSAYSSMSQRSRSVASLAGMSVVKGNGNGVPETVDWARLDEYAAYLHEQDALRQRVGTQALQKKMRQDLDEQIKQRKQKAEMEKMEDFKYHQHSMGELERWKRVEQAREEERHYKLMREKQDRDEQLEFERRMKAQEAEKKKADDAALVGKIVSEMEAEQKRYEKKKAQAKKSMRKIFEENAEEQRKREAEKKDEIEKEAQAMQDFNRILDEQEEQRAEEMQKRLDRQTALMRQLQDSVHKIEKGDQELEERLLQQQEVLDRQYMESETAKQSRLKQMRQENQAYLMKQMTERDERKKGDKELQAIQRDILLQDAQEFEHEERAKVQERRLRALDHKKDIEDQIRYRHGARPQPMSQDEVKMNKPLLEIVSKTLSTAERPKPNMRPQSEYDGDEE